MAATLNALIGQYAGSSWDAAFPQPPGESPNLDLIHIRGIGNQVLAVVNHAGAVSGGSTSALVLTSVSVASLVLTSVSVASLVLTSVSVASLVLTSVVGATGVYHGTITGGAANAFVGKTVIIAGFATGGNNGSFVVTASDATTITVAPTTQVDETHAGTAGIVGTTLVTYNGTITGGDTSAFAGKSAIIAGFATSANNGTFTLTDSSATTLVTTLTAQVNETHAGTAGIVGTTLVTYNGTITGGGTNNFAGKNALIAGFSTSANNGTYAVVSNTTTTIVAVLTAQVNETHAGTAGIVGTTLVTYNGTITGGGSSALAGSTAVFAGFTNSTNNTTQVITSSTASTIVVPLIAQVNETHAGTAGITLSFVAGGTRIGTYKTFLDNTATIAALFANAFANPSQQDILQIVSPAGENVVNYIDYQGVSH